MVNSSQNAKSQEDSSAIETVVNGYRVRISFSETGSEEISSCIRGILKTAYLRCNTQ